MARRAVEAVARAHRRCRRLLAPPTPRSRRVAVGLALVLAVSFALPFLPGTEGVAYAEAIERAIASWWEEEKYIDPMSSDYKPMKSHDWAQGFRTGACDDGTGFQLSIVTIKFQDPSTDGATADRLELTLHSSARIPFASTKLATFRQHQSRIVKQRRTTQEKRGEYFHTVGTYTPTTAVTLQPNTHYWLQLMDPAVDGADAAVSTAAVSLTASDDEARTGSNEAHWMGENKWKIDDTSRFRTRGGDTSTSEGWNKSEDSIRLFIGASTSCGYVDEEPPESINTERVVRAVPEDWPLVPTRLRAGDRFRLLFVTKGTRDATSTDIATYNSFVQSQCTSGGVEAIQDYCSDFRVVGSTSSVSARDNTYTNWRRLDRGLPVYWMNSDALSADLVDAPYAPYVYGLPNLIQTPALAAPTYQIFYLWWLNRDGCGSSS